jgi:hypothetical protein
MRDPRSMPRTCSRRPKLYERSIIVPSEGSRREQRLRASSCVWTFHTNNRQNVRAPTSGRVRAVKSLQTYKYNLC